MKTVAVLVTGTCLFVLCALGSVRSIALGASFYDSFWETTEASEDTGMSLADLSRAGQTLRGYFRGREDSPQISAVIQGEERPLYNEKELEHLSDVKGLFSQGFAIEKGTAAAGLAALAYLILIRKDPRAAGNGMILAGSLGPAVFLLLTFAMKQDFTGLWIKFHRLAFINDLWLLDPDKDWLIRMFPERFFFNATRSIGVRTALSAASLLALGLIVRYRSPHHRHQDL